MRYLPILEELCSSDSVLFMAAGVIVSFCCFIGVGGFYLIPDRDYCFGKIKVYRRKGLMNCNE